MPMLFGMAHIVEHRLRFPTLADSKHDSRLVAHCAVAGLLKNHIVIKVHIVKRLKATDCQSVHDICPNNIGKALAGREHFSAAALHK